MSKTYPKATLFGTEVRHLTSSITGQDYRISVWLIPSYSSSEKTYPVLYLLDANFSMGMAVDTARWLVFAQEVPELIIVGIGQAIQSYDDFGNNRNRDYTPTASSDVAGSGGAAKFLAFLESELIPFVEANYRTDPTNRSIWGYSLGGLFVLYTLLQKPSLFQRYIAGTPAVNWDERIMFRYEKELAEKQSVLPATVYISVGTAGSLEVDLKPHVDEFVKIFNSRKYDELNLKTELFEGETHFSGFARSFYTGLKAIF